MASISKLSIRGVRSFSPNDEEQVIGFCFPLTIIVGANGCGKTTIIESLKYAVTGSLPPGNKSGQSFVHDPKSVGQSVVKANVKLRFNNRGNQSMVVIRSMEVTQKTSTATFKALDGIIRTVDPSTGERVSLSHKCTELDRQIPHLMGVSKPILEHVVFCHQEDSSWPLQEGAILKKRFDDIFDSTRYAKALEEIKSTRKEYASQVKDLKAELEGLKSHKHAASSFIEELENCKDQIAQFDNDIQRYNDGIEKEKNILMEADKILTEINVFRQDVNSRQSELERVDAVRLTQKEMLGQDDMTGEYSYEELRTMLRDLSDKRYGSQALRDLEEKQSEADYIAKELEKKRNLANELNSKKGKLEAEKDAHNLLLKQRFEIMEEIHKKHGVECDLSQTQDEEAFTQGTAASKVSIFTSGCTTIGEDFSISQEDIEAFQHAIRRKEINLRDNLESTKSKHRSEEDMIQKEIADLQSQMATVNADIQRIENAKNVAMKELGQVSSQISSAYSRIRKSDVDEAKKTLAELVKSRDECNKDPRLDEITCEIRVHEDKLKSISDRIEHDVKIRDQLRLQSNSQAEIEMLEKQATLEFDALQEKIRENSGYLLTSGENLTVTKHDPVYPLQIAKDSIRKKYDVNESDIERCNNALVEIQRKLTEKNALMANHRSRIAHLKHKANQLDLDDGPLQKFSRVVNALLREEGEQADPNEINVNSPPTVVLAYITDIINEGSSILKDEQIAKVIISLKKMGGRDAACPCCTRAFSSNADSKVFNDRMGALSDVDTSELIQKNQLRTRKGLDLLSKYERWRQTVSDSITVYNEFSLINAEIKDLEAHLVAEGDTELNKLKTALEEKEIMIKAKKEGSKVLMSLLEVVNTMLDMADRYWGKSRQLKDKKEELKKYLIYLYISTAEKRNLLGYVHLGNDQRDLKTVEKDLTESSATKESAYSQISKLNNEQKLLNERITRITNQVTAAEHVAREKEDSYNRDQIALIKKDELNQQLQQLALDSNLLEKSITPLRQQLLQKSSKRDSIRKTNDYEETSLVDKLRELQQDVLKLQSNFDMIDSYVRLGKDKDIEQVQIQLLHNAEEIRDNEVKLENMKPKIEQLKKQVEESERQKTKIQSNLELIKISLQVNELTEEHSKMVEEMNMMGEDNAEERHHKARNAMNEYKDAKARIEGRLQGLNEQKRALKRKLHEPEYHDVEERHRVKMIEFETTNILVTDLDKYYDALDKALLRYHGMKIDDINKIIRDLWALTYKGEDITNIQITSDQDSGGRATRSYNYRIVMTKGHTQMDMRGRCSAGQRVLASIVIRLALAETFCLNCGVMALDEPTTNLDYENKRGLAIALAQIIASRAAQSNFQLVVITHDEDFVSMMKQELSSQTGFNMPERYYQVSREQGHDGRFYSKINAIDWDEL